MSSQTRQSARIRRVGANTAFVFVGLLSLPAFCIGFGLVAGLFSLIGGDSSSSDARVEDAAGLICGLTALLFNAVLVVLVWRVGTSLSRPQQRQALEFSDCCVGCGYPLYGLTGIRCPECGRMLAGAPLLGRLDPSLCHPVPGPLGRPSSSGGEPALPRTQDAVHESEPWPPGSDT